MFIGFFLTSRRTRRWQRSAPGDCCTAPSTTPHIGTIDSPNWNSRSRPKSEPRLYRPLRQWRCQGILQYCNKVLPGADFYILSLSSEPPPSIIYKRVSALDRVDVYFSIRNQRCCENVLIFVEIISDFCLFPCFFCYTICNPTITFE